MLALLLLPSSHPRPSLTQPQSVWISPHDKSGTSTPALLVPVPQQALEKTRLKSPVPVALPADPPPRSSPARRPLAKTKSPKKLGNRDAFVEDPFRYLDLKGKWQTLHRVIQLSNSFFDPQTSEWQATAPPREWPPTLKWPQDAMRCRRTDDHCMVCNEKELCRCDVVQWRAAHSWATVRELRMMPGKGIGCITLRTWLPGDLLGDYCGEIRPYNDYEHNPYCLAVSVYGSSSKRIAMVDSLARGNWTRFVNHSCNANLRFKECNVGGHRIYALVALREIDVGEELTVDYGPGYMGQDGQCHCGEAKCRYKKKRRRVSPRK